MTRWIVAALALIGLAAGYAAWLAHERQMAADWARYQAIREQRDYTADSVACSLRFPSGGAGRVNAYDDSLRFHGYQAELAASSDDSEGEHWAEFYSAGSDAAAAALVADFRADLDHVLIRQRLWQLYLETRLPDAVDELLPGRHTLATGDQSGWVFHIGWISTPYLPAGVLPAEGPQQRLPGTMLDAMRATKAPPWQWRALTEPGLQTQAREYADAERHALGWLKPESDDYRKTRDRFQRLHHHFYLVEGARDLGGGHVLILRRFGELYGPGSITRAALIIAQMADSLSCRSAEAESAPGH